MGKRIIRGIVLLAMAGSSIPALATNPPAPALPIAKVVTQSVDTSGNITNETTTVATPDQQTGNCTSASAHSTDHCFISGVLVIPFKAELKGNRDVFGSANIGGFAGVNIFKNHNLTFLFFASYSTSLNSSSTTTGTSSGSGSGGSPTTSTTASQSGALSWGVGFAEPIGTTTAPNGQKPHLGFVVGFDHEANSLNYVYNNKPWLSVLIGTNF